MVTWYDSARVACGCLAVGLIALLAGPLSVRAQNSVPEFEVDAVSMRVEAGSALTRLDIYTRIPYDHLTFITTPNGFSATYEIAAAVYKIDDRNRWENLVQTRIWESSAQVDIYAETQSEQSYSHTTHAIDLEPGRYMLELQLTDRNSEEMYVHQMPVEVRDVNRSLALSDILLINEYDQENNTIFPRVSEIIGSDEFEIQLFYEIYSDTPRSVSVTRDVIPIRKRTSAFKRTARTLLGIPEEEDPPVAISYTYTESLALEAGRRQFVATIPVSDLKVGDYLVRIQVYDPSTQQADTVERTFSTLWTGLAAHLSNLEEAINQMEYIAKPKDLRALKAATTPEEQLRRFQDFWNKYDPTPGTLRNERMEEYYYRISAANRAYTSVTPGWKTDRGQVLVSFGEPDHIDRHTYDFDADPWEVWYYERMGRKFIFIDKTGFGDYELLIPIWDERNRIR